MIEIYCSCDVCHNVLDISEEIVCNNCLDELEQEIDRLRKENEQLKCQNNLLIRELEKYRK